MTLSTISLNYFESELFFNEMTLLQVKFAYKLQLCAFCLWEKLCGRSFCTIKQSISDTLERHNIFYHCKVILWFLSIQFDIYSMHRFCSVTSKFFFISSRYRRGFLSFSYKQTCPPIPYKFNTQAVGRSSHLMIAKLFKGIVQYF